MDSLEIDFARIVREHRSTIYTVCYMFSKDEEEVADLFQEILINLWSGFQKFRGDCNLNTWVYRISLNTCISSERKKKSRGETVPLKMNINLFDDSGEDIKQIRLLQERISRLGPFDRAIILLWLENMSYDEIGAIVGISAKNVSVRLFRIKEQLKKMSNQ
jgi:RNA polymerase sigma-70 factor (ECF subfamily)